MPPDPKDVFKHIVVLMMENRSFDHMLGGLRHPGVVGLTGNEWNPDFNGNQVFVQAKAEYQGQLDPDPGHHFEDVDRQIFNSTDRAEMKGFVLDFYQKRKNLKRSRHVMYYFKQEDLPVLSTLATEFLLFNNWFSSIPGPTLCNRAFAHYGTSFGHVGMEIRYSNQKYKSVYERLLGVGHSAKVYYFDESSSSLEVANLLDHQAEFFGSYDQFLDDCRRGTLPEYSLIEPNYSDHDGDSGRILATDQHPDHSVLEGERFIAEVYNAIKSNHAVWESTLFLITYDEHGGTFDHVTPPAPTQVDEFTAPADKTKTGKEFKFDRLGVRVPAILVSPWISRGTIENRVFEHASIAATATEFFIGDYDERSPREKAANTFSDLLNLDAPRIDDDTPTFRL